MTADSTLPEPPPSPDVAALMASPEFQAQMAALQKQAAAQLAALIESLRNVQLPPTPVPETKTDDSEVASVLPGIDPPLFLLAPPDPVALPTGEWDTSVAGPAVMSRSVPAAPLAETVSADALKPEVIASSAVIEASAAIEDLVPVTLAAAPAPAQVDNSVPTGAAAATPIEAAIYAFADFRAGAEGTAA